MDIGVSLPVRISALNDKVLIGTNKNARTMAGKYAKIPTTKTDLTDGNKKAPLF
ncbi:hypothetical protein [Chania multitudinisentens]|uniref:hypothetical protein n=1 Tax=Chania multitudinisentens TaxID=1639108 RepID=UPI0003E136AE|nr:hypothetical protein [Chania multitudinisentens]